MENCMENFSAAVAENNVVVGGGGKLPPPPSSQEDDVLLQVATLKCHATVLLYNASRVHNKKGWKRSK